MSTQVTDTTTGENQVSKVERTIKGFFRWLSSPDSTIVCLVGLGAFGMLLTLGTEYGSLGGSLVVSTAVFSVGWLIGFLFGHPKSANSDLASKEERFLPNTNLEQISDSVTKMLLGVGLVGASTIYQFVLSASASLVPDTKVPAPFWSAAIVLFSVAGFLHGYRKNRLTLHVDMANADRRAQQYPDQAAGTPRPKVTPPPPDKGGES